MSVELDISLPANRPIWKLRNMFVQWIVPLLPSAFWCTLILVIHRNSPRTLISFHGLLHAGIAGEFLAGQTAVPSDNPFYAGEPVAYYWFFHFLAAQLTRLLNLNIFHSFELMIIVSTGVLLTAAFFLGRKLYHQSLCGFLIGYLVLAGTNPFGWLFLIYKVARYGWQITNDNPNHLWGVVHPIYSLVRYDDVGGLYGPLLNFFLNITSRPLALAGLMLLVLCLEWQFRSGQKLAWVAIVLTTAATTAFSPIIGVMAGSVILGSLVLVRLVRQLVHSRRDCDISWSRVVSTSIAIVIGLLISAPTYVHLLLGPSSAHSEFVLFSVSGLRHLMFGGLSVSVLLILAITGAHKSRDTHWPFLYSMTLAGLMLLAVDIAFRLQAGNSSNCFHAAVVLLSVPAAGGILRNAPTHLGPPNKWLAIACIVLFLPTTALLAMSYVNRPNVQASFDALTLQRTPESSDLARLYNWIQTETDRKAVFVVDPSNPTMICGNTAELPAMTGRALFTAGTEHYISEPYRDSKLREEITQRLLLGEVPNDSDLAYLSKLNRPLYLLSNDADPELKMRMEKVYGPPAFAQGSISVYTLAPLANSASNLSP